MNKTDLSRYDNSWYNPGAGIMKRTLWYFVNIVVFKSGLFPFSCLKVFLLRLFGAIIGTGVTIKPCVSIKYPWNLTMGNHVWLGDDTKIENLLPMIIGDNCCISQGAMILDGNHDYKKVSFDLRPAPVKLTDGVWIGARSVVCPGVTCGEGSVLCVGSIAVMDMEDYSVYQGNPAVKVRSRQIDS